MRTLALLLIPILAFPRFLIVTGSSLGKGPFISIKAIFSTDYPQVKSLADFNLQIVSLGGNLFFNSGSLLDSIKSFQLDMDTVQLSYGWLRPDLEVPDTVPPGNWLLRIGKAYIDISSNPKMWVNLCPIFVEAGMRERAVGIVPKFGEIGGGYLMRKGKGEIILNIGKLFLGFSEKGVSVSLNTPKVVVSFKDGRTSAFFWNKNGYVQINEDGTKFIERVGLIYVIGRFSRREKELGIGFQF